MERRGDERVPFEARVNLICDRPLTRIVGRSTNLSRAGLFVATPSPPSLASRLVFEVLGHGGACVLKGRGEVVWARVAQFGPHRPAGVAIRFVEIGETSRHRINQLLARGGVDQEAAVGVAASGVATTPFRPRADATWFGGLDSGEEATAGCPLPVAADADETPRVDRGSNRARRGRLAVLISTLLLVACVAVALMALGPGRQIFGRAPQPTDHEVVAVAGVAPPADEPSQASSAPLSEKVRPPDIVVSTAEERPIVAGTWQARRIRTISYYTRGDETLVTIVADGVLLPGSVRGFRMHDPPRHVVRIRDITEEYPRQQMDAATRQVASIRVGLHRDVHPPELAVVLDLVTADVKVHAVDVDGNRVTLRFGDSTPE